MLRLCVKTSLKYDVKADLNQVSNSVLKCLNPQGDPGLQQNLKADPTIARGQKLYLDLVWHKM